MAQKTEKEDVPEATLTPCINNMPLTATVSTNTNCFNNNNNTDLTTSSSCPISEPLRPGIEAKTKNQEMKREFISVEMMGLMEKPAATNRCSGCRRKVGLTGFLCRCGDVFCAVHRYSDRHACSYDYKAAGKAAIARENPIVKSAKIVRI